MLSPMQTHVRTHYDRALRDGNRDELLVAAAVAADVADCVVCQVDEYVTLTQYALKMRAFSLRTILKEANIRPPSPNAVGPGDQCGQYRCDCRRAPQSRYCPLHVKEAPMLTDEMSFAEKEKMSNEHFMKLTGWQLKPKLYLSAMYSIWADGKRRKIDAWRREVFALDHLRRAVTQDGTQAILAAPYGLSLDAEADLDLWCAEHGLRWFQFRQTYYPFPSDAIGLVPVDWPGPDWDGAPHKPVGVNRPFGGLTAAQWAQAYHGRMHWRSMNRAGYWVDHSPSADLSDPYQALRVKCPDCGAEPGSWCVFLTRHGSQHGNHPKRQNLGMRRQW